jgi:hypothetical protein
VQHYHGGADVSVTLLPGDRWVALSPGAAKALARMLTVTAEKVERIRVSKELRAEARRLEEWRYR